MREGKIEHLDTWLAARGQALGDFPESWFYSDSINDLPLLERVTHPVAVDADAKLAEIAAERGWRSSACGEDASSPGSPGCCAAPRPRPDASRSAASRASMAS